MDTLARAYAFLMECGQMSWQQLEAKAIQPYNCEAWFRGQGGVGWEARCCMHYRAGVRLDSSPLMN